MIQTFDKFINEATKEEYLVKKDGNKLKEKWKFAVIARPIMKNVNNVLNTKTWYGVEFFNSEDEALKERKIWKSVYIYTDFDVITIDDYIKRKILFLTVPSIL